jgi:hypothetical protein
VKTKDFVALGNRLLPHFPGFAIKEKLFFISPVRHTLRGFFFEPSAFSQEHFYVNVFFLPLCVPAKHVHFTFGYRIGDKKRWNASVPDFDTKLISEMLKEVPFLTKLNGPRDVAQALYPLTKRSNPHCHEAFAYALIQSEKFSLAVEALDTLLKLADTSVAWQQEIVIRVRLIRDKLLNSPEEAKKHLAIWESDTALNLGLNVS